MHDSATNRTVATLTFFPQNLTIWQSLSSTVRGSPVASTANRGRAWRKRWGFARVILNHGVSTPDTGVRRDRANPAAAEPIVSPGGRHSARQRSWSARFGFWPRIAALVGLFLSAYFFVFAQVVADAVAGSEPLSSSSHLCCHDRRRLSHGAARCRRQRVGLDCRRSGGCCRFYRHRPPHTSVPDAGRIVAPRAGGRGCCGWRALP